MGLFADLKWADGQVNPSGIATELFYIPKSDIKTFPTVAPVPGTPTANVLLAGDFELVATKTWFRLHSTQGKGELNFEPIGEKECKLFMNKGKFHFPDISDAAKSHAKQSVNSSMVYIAKLPHPSEKRYIVLGDLDYDTESKVSGASGGEPGSQKGLTIEVDVPCFTPLPGYAGDILLSNGSLDCATGVFISIP